MIEAKQEVAVGAVLSAAPWWTEIIHGISSVAGFVAIVTGALIGLHGVWRIGRHWWRMR